MMRRLTLKPGNWFLICSLCFVFTVAQAQDMPAMADSVITENLLKGYVQTLSDDKNDGRLTGTTGNQTSAQWIGMVMRDLELDTIAGPAVSGNFGRWRYKDEQLDIRGTNVLGQIPGISPDSIILFSAHYDHIGRKDGQPYVYMLTQLGKDAGKDQLFNGANDNASGVAAMLALAHFYKLLGKPKYSIWFVAFSGEEFGLKGSTAMAASFFSGPFANRVVVQNINLEMLGRPTSSEPFITEDGHHQQLRHQLNETLAGFGYGRKYFKADPYDGAKLFERSDNFSFAQMGVPANTIMATPPNDEFYHHADDEWQTLNYRKMTAIVRAIALGCTGLVGFFQ